MIQIFTDGSKDLTSGRTAAAFFIPKYNINISKRTTDHIQVFTAELIAVSTALHCTEGRQNEWCVICTESQSALESLESGVS